MPDINRERRRAWVEQQLASLPCSTAEHRRFLSIPPMEHRWHLLVERIAAFPPANRAAAFAIGPTGVFAFVFTDDLPDRIQLQRIRKHAEETFASLVHGRSQYVPHMLEVLLLMPTAAEVDGQGRFRAVDLRTLRRTLLSGEAVLSVKQARFIGTEVAARNNRYVLISTDDAPRAETPSVDGLFATTDLREDERGKVLGRPFQEWMTFLDPDQLALVHRSFRGPARFSGPAGTGKTVVALHRMAHHAKRNPGRLLFTSFVKTLPTYHQSGFARLAPQATERAEFVGLHAWTLRFLNERDVTFDLDTTAAETSFSHAWQRARTTLAPIEPSPAYWREELHRVIKGRGITTLAEYIRIRRTGRSRIILDEKKRTAVWDELYTPYQQLLEARGAQDFNDVIDRAIEELRTRPLAEPYSLVVVDEVQDFTLTELKLVHQIAGGTHEAPLLLVGDGQQQVYSGGWRLSDAGIPIKNRGAVLRVNYRNRAAVHEYAKHVDATNIVDDLDGAPGFVLRDTEIVLPGGRAIAVHVRRRDIDARLIQAIEDSGVPWSDIAVIVTTNRDADRLLTVLARAGIDTMALDKYDGTHRNAVKVGTVHRAKGMDFSAVFHSAEIPKQPIDHLKGGERDRAELAARQSMVALTRARDQVWIGLIED